jgi:hypothetical protein
MYTVHRWVLILTVSMYFRNGKKSENILEKANILSHLCENMILCQKDLKTLLSGYFFFLDKRHIGF